jgi:hypothetical protein
VLGNGAHASLSATNSATEGPFVLSTAGTTLTPGESDAWTIEFGDGSTDLVGTGAPPLHVSHVYPSGEWTVRMDILFADATSADSIQLIRATTPVPRVQYFGEENGMWTPAAVATDVYGADAVSFGGYVSPADGGHVTSGTVTFGDGAGTAIPAIGNGRFGEGQADVVHGYTVPGEYTATLRARDSTGRTAVGITHVSVAGKPTATLPATGAGVHATPFALPLTAVSAGANAGSGTFDINWGDGETELNPDSLGYGLPSGAALAHTYAAAGTYLVTVTIYNDHNSELLLTSSVTIT